MDFKGLELIIFRYIHKEDFTQFAKKMDERGIPIRGAARVMPTAPLELWDYPWFEEENLDPSLISKKIAQETGTQLNLTELKYVLGILIDPPPSHYPFRYAIACHFVLEENKIYSNPKEVLNILQNATTEVKKFTDVLSLNSKFRPVIWFIREVSDLQNFTGLIGVTNRSISFSGQEILIERGFPQVSYIIYGMEPEKEHLSDITLVAVIAHLVERGYRNELANLFKKIQNSIEHHKLTEIQATLPKEVPRLEESLERLYLLSGELSPLVEQYYSIRRRLIRTSGFVERVREKCGSLEKKNLVDIICDDAIVIVEKEVEVILNEVEARIKGINNTIENISNHLTGKHNRLMQVIGQLLQSSAVAFIVFQILAEISPTDLIYRSAVLIFATLLSGFSTYILLKWRLQRWRVKQKK